MQHENIQDVVERARQQRAEHIGAAIRKHPIVTALIVVLPMLLIQVPWSRLATVADVVSSVRSIVSMLG